MKKITILLVICILCFSSFAQDRVNSDGIKLSYKSQELKKAKFWEKDEATGRWESSKSNSVDYGGVGDENFLSIYFGMTEYQEEQKIIFYRLFQKGYYKYPHLEMYWMNHKSIDASIISIEQYENLKNIQPNEVIQLNSFDLDNEWFGSAYNKDRFLYTLLLNSVEIPKDKKREVGVFLAKRTTSDGCDVVRFRFGQGKILGYSVMGDLDNSYFEVAYKDFLKLFTKGKL